MKASDFQAENWAVERFYWAVVDAPGFDRAGVLPPGARGEFDEQVPVESDELQVVCAPMGHGRLLACAAPRRELAALGPEVLSLTPAAVPEFAVDLVDPSILNLLAGPFEPRALRRAHTNRAVLSMVTVGACAAFVCIGLLRREQIWREESRQTDAAVTLVERSVMPEGLSLAVELERARREAGVEVKPPADAAVALASLLASWPTAVSSKPLTLGIGGSSASISVTVEGDPAPFLKALSPPSGWTLDEPRLMTIDKLTRLNLTLRRTSGAQS